MRCSYCCSFVDLERLRVIGKTAQNFRCNTCNTKMSQLRREFGQWPTDEFGRTTTEEKRDFYLQIQACATNKEVLQFARDRLRKYERHEEVYAESGKSKGYDDAAIKENSREENIGWCDVVGQVYRLPIRSFGRQGCRGQMRDQEQSAQGRKRKLENALAALDNGKTGDDSDDSSSSTSSSSSEKKKKKKKEEQ